MASTIDTGFEILNARLEITEAQHSAIVSHQGQLEKVLSKGFDTHGTMFSGAYSRNTMIAVKQGAAVDLFLLLRANAGHQYTPERLIDHLHETLLQHHEDAFINTNGHGVVVSCSEYQFIIVPCIAKENKGCIIPDYKNNQWLMINPGAYSDQFKEANKWHNGKLLPLVKMIKCWNVVVNNIFDEYYLEVLAKNILTGVPITTYSSAIRYVFNKATLQVAFTLDDPAGFGEQVQGLKDGDKIAEAMLSFHDAYKTMLNAQEHEHEGKLDKAYDEWESIFTGFFPTPLQMLIQELENSGIEGVKALKIIRDRTINSEQ